MSQAFLEIALPSEDLIASLAFYQALGFSELTTNDARVYPYAAVSDGQVVIGLHQRELIAPTLTIIQPDLARFALSLSDSPALVQMNIDPDNFNEILLQDPDGHSLMLAEARTYSPMAENTTASLFGHCLEFTLPVREAIKSAQFWAPFAPRSMGVSEDPKMHLRFSVDNLPLGLSEQMQSRTPQLCYQVDDLATLGQAADRLGMRLAPCRIGVGDCLSQFTTPEGLTIALFQEDFLVV